MRSRAIANHRRSPPKPRPPKKSPTSSAELIALPRIPTRVSDLLEQRNYAEAIKAIDAALVAHDPAADYLSYLKGRALYAAGQYDRRSPQFDRFAKELSQKHLGSPGKVRQSGGSGAQGRVPRRRGDLSGGSRLSVVRRRASKRSPTSISNSPTPISSRKTSSFIRPSTKRRWSSIKRRWRTSPPALAAIEVELRVARCFQLLNQLPDAAKRTTPSSSRTIRTPRR